MNTEIIRILLQDCLNQFEALNNSCKFTHSEPLRDRLKEALGLPVEPARCESCFKPLVAGDTCSCEE